MTTAWNTTKYFDVVYARTVNSQAQVPLDWLERRQSADIWTNLVLL